MTIKATITAENRIEACGLVARSEFDLCRALIEAGHNWSTPLETQWPDGRPSMRIRTLADGAGLTVMENGANGPRFAKWAPSPWA